jgi:hypothetical protein
MLDINTLIKQEDSNRKLNLLKQIKLSIESLMFDTTTNTNRSSCHSLGIITILSRHVLAILEDNIDTTNDNMSNSPGTGANNSRSITQSSIEVTSLLLQNNEIDDALWCFILFTFKSDNNNNNNNNNEMIAKKEFELIYTQIKRVKEQELADNMTNDFNFAFNWILACLRQNLLFNQMSYLLADSNLIEKFYKPLAFLQDRLFVNDFLNLIKAYETRDYNILKKIKRNFFTTTINNNENNNKNIRSLTTTPTTNTTATSSSSSSHTSSINLQNHFNEIPLILSSDNNNNKSLIELAINEINLTSKLKNTHRRMHSIPNIQINEAKRNRLLMTESFNSNVVMNTNNNNLNVSDSIDQNESFNKSESIASSPLPPPPPLTKIIENQLSTSTLLLNNQIENNLQSNSEEISNDKIIVDYNDSNDIYHKTTVFDFIHSQQINCDCNQVDKENSHFIIADIAMTAFELIKTQDLNDLNQLDINNENNNDNTVKLRKNYNNFLTINTNINNINAKKNRIKSTEIKIDNNKLKNKSRDTNSLQFVGSFNSSISPITNGGIFSSDDYASSIEKEVFFTSGCGSPNLDALSSSSLMSTTKQDNAHKKRHKKSLR